MKKLRFALLFALMLLCALTVSAQAACGHSATRKHTKTGYGKYRDGVALSDQQHQIVVDVIEYTVCNLCGDETQKTIEEGKVIVENHRYHNDGNIKCGYCDYVNTCHHLDEKKRSYQNYFENIHHYAWFDNQTHSFIAKQVQRMDCAACYGYEYTTLVEEGIFYENHSLINSQDFCPTCERSENYIKCAHPSTHKERLYTNVQNMRSLDAQGHAFTADHYIELTVCEECASYMSMTILSELGEYIEPHPAGDAPCFMCGYKDGCAHENQSKRTQHLDRSDMRPGTYNSHTYKAKVVEEYYCSACTLPLYQVVMEENTLTESHKLQAGLCSECGYLDLDALFDHLRAQTGAQDVTIEVNGAEGLFRETEYKKLQSLPEAERIPIVLAAAGCYNEALYALERSCVRMSPESAQLQEEVTMRLLQQWAPSASVVNQYFQITEVTISGKAQNALAFDLVITANGNTQLLRYALATTETTRDYEWRIVPLN